MRPAAREKGACLALRDESDDRGTPAGATLRPGAITALLAEIARCEPSEPLPSLTPGARVGRYEIIRPIGHGGFGSVYEAHDAALHRLVALKVLRPTQTGSPESASEEGEAAARLAHPNIASLHDAGVLDGGAPYLVYELLHGETLESRLGRGPIPPREALAIAAQVARALVHAHGAGVVHRDLKPANVFLTVDGDVKVLDFGLALLFGREGPAGGTPAYMSPEQKHGEPEDARTDLYALGLMLREMLCGERGIQGDGFSSRVPDAAGRVLASLLAEEPTSRPRSASAALAAIEAAARATSGAGTRRRTIAATALALVTALAALLLRERPPPGAPAQATVPSIAVLPFADLSPQQDQEYFSDGLSEEILNALGRVEGLRVIARTSSFSFKGKNEDLETIARKLHVTDVLEGSVRREGSRVRITAQLIAASSGHQRWAETYDRELTDIFAIQEEIARAVVAVLKVKLLPGEAPSTDERSTVSDEAYRQYLLGRHFALQGTVAGHLRAMAAFEKAVAADPSYAPAWAGMSSACFWYAESTDSVAERDEYHRRALDAAEKAVAARPRLADGYAARGFMRTVQFPPDWEGAEADLRRALQLNPRDAATLRYYGKFLLAARGRLEEGIAALRTSTESDPLYAPGWRSLGGIYKNTNLPLARAAVERALEIAPDSYLANYQLASILLLEGRAAEARAAAHRIEDDFYRVFALALAEHSLGHAAESDRALEELTRRHAATGAYQIAQVHAWRGDRERAFTWLERAYAQHDGGLRELLHEPMFRSLRGDSRWAPLLRKVGLPTD